MLVDLGDVVCGIKFPRDIICRAWPEAPGDGLVDFTEMFFQKPKILPRVALANKS